MVAVPAAADTKPYVVPDAVVGYRYAPNTRMTLPRPGGGHYELAINADGIRADREYARAKPAGTRRIVVCGDSMAAGQFVSNTQRFSELLERRLPGTEVMNLALEGSGTDQQVLIYEQVGLRYEHDLVVLLPFLQNIRRNLAGAREAIDPRTGARVLRPKPRFELVDGVLHLHPPRLEGAQRAAAAAAALDEPPSFARSVKAFATRMPGARLAKGLLYRVMPWEPFPEYRDPDGAAWRLMAALIQRLRNSARPRPVVIAPTFYSSYVQFPMARNYWERFSSLEGNGIHAIDLLPHFRSIGADAPRCFQDPHDMHFSALGHLVLADALQSELTSRGLLSNDG